MDSLPQSISSINVEMDSIAQLRELSSLEIILLRAFVLAVRHLTG